MADGRAVGGEAGRLLGQKLRGNNGRGAYPVWYGAEKSQPRRREAPKKRKTARGEGRGEALLHRSCYKNDTETAVTLVTDSVARPPKPLRLITGTNSRSSAHGSEKRSDSRAHREFARHITSLSAKWCFFAMSMPHNVPSASPHSSPFLTPRAHVPFLLAAPSPLRPSVFDGKEEGLLPRAASAHLSPTRCGGLGEWEEA